LALARAIPLSSMSISWPRWMNHSVCI
jgi:hypothetical protein